MLRLGSARQRAVPVAVGLLGALCVQVLSVSPAFAASGDINTVAGNGTAGYSGDGGPATSAELNSPSGLRPDGAGNVYVTDGGNNVIRKIDSLGDITTVAGNGTSGFSGDGGAATSAQLSSPGAVALDTSGDLFIADNGNYRVRKVDPSGTITTVAGSGGPGYSTGDGGPALDATLGPIGGIAVDASGNLYIGDTYFHIIRKVDTSGTISRYAGTGVQRDRGDGGPASAAAISQPSGMSIDPSGNLFVASGFPADNIRKIDLASGIITTVAGRLDADGTGFPGDPPSGDGGPATLATFARPVDVTVDESGSLYIADIPGPFNTDNAIRKVDGATGIITTVAGSVTAGFSGDGGPATSALLNSPSSAAPLGHGSFLVADSANNVLRAVTGSPDLLTLAKGAPQEVPAGGAYTYRLAVRNDGSAGAATGVTLTDPLPAGTTFVGATPSQGSCTQSGGTVTCSLGDVAANSVASVSIDVTAPSQSTAVVNTASVTANESDPVTSDNSASATTFVDAADLAVTLAASPDSGVNVGQLMTYTATVTNQGPTAATGVTLTDPLPSGMSFVSAAASQGSCAQSGATVTCGLGGLAAGAQATVTVQVKLTAAGATSNAVTVAGDQIDPFPQTNTASARSTISGAGCGQVITKSTTLKQDIGPCAGDGVIIGADNIKLNLGGHKIFGFGTGVGFATTDGLVGIRLPVRTGVTVSGGTVSGFDTGIFINSGLSNTVSNMTVRDNIGLESSVGPFYPELGDGILIEHSSFNKIVSNLVAHNGTYDGIGLFGLDTNGNLIQGNTIQDTVSNLAHVDGEGVIINNFLASSEPRRGESISHNDIVNNIITGNAASGISNVSNTSARIQNNTVNNNGLTAFPSNGIGDQVGRVADPTALDTISGNRVSGNGGDGIQILRPITGDTITGNIANSNNANNDGSFNFEDSNGNCTSNSWSKNTSINGTVSPPCVLSGGKKPPAQPTNPAAATTADPPQPQANRRLPPPPSG